MQKEEFKDRISQYKGSLMDICDDICQVINSEPEESEKIDLFIIACENFGLNSNCENMLRNSIITNDTLRDIEIGNTDAIEAIITSSIKVAISNEYSTREFYGYLWKSISSAYQDRLLVFALYKILSDRRIPYYQISQGMAMEDSEYSEIIQTCLNDINKCRFILDVDFDQKTKEASNLLKVILSHDVKKEQIVILSQILTYCKLSMLSKLEETVQALSEDRDVSPKSSDSTDV